jgi:hypothetical protein
VKGRQDKLKASRTGHVTGQMKDNIWFYANQEAVYGCAICQIALPPPDLFIMVRSG